MKTCFGYKKLWLFVTMLMMTVLLSGCSDKKSENLDEASLVFHEERLSCMDEIKGSVSQCKVYGDDVFIYTIDWNETELEQYFYTCKADGSGLTEIPYEREYTDSEWLHDMSISPEKEMCLLFSSYENDIGTYLFRVVGADGKISHETDIKELVGTDELAVYDMEIDKDGNIYLLDGYCVYIMDAQYRFKACVEEENAQYMSAMVLSDRGTVLIGFEYENGYEFKEIDPEKKTFCASYRTKLKAVDFRNSYCNKTMAYAQTDELSEESGCWIYYDDGDSLYKYDLMRGTSQKLTDWMMSNINTNKISGVEVLSDESFLIAYEETDGEDFKLYMFNKVASKDIAEKEIVTYGSLYADENMRERAIAFNKSQNDYHILLKDYEDKDNPVSAMHKDLIAGNGADIMDLSGLSSDKYLVKGLFEDLYPYMENDPDISNKDFLDNILEIMETDGKLYHISPSFGVNVVAASASDVTEGSVCTIRDVETLEQTLSGAKAFYFVTNVDVLSQHIEMNYDSYMNWQEGTCSFDSDEFLAALKYAGTYPSGGELDIPERAYMPEELIADRLALFFPIYSMSLEDLAYYEELYDGNAAFIAAPSSQFSGGAMNMERDLVISAASENKEGAWQFLKTLLGEEYKIESSMEGMISLSIRKDNLEAFLDRNLDNGIVTKEQAQKYRQVIEAMDHKYLYDLDIQQIVTEEADDYFEGRMKPEQAAANIQKKISQYMQDYIGQ